MARISFAFFALGGLLVASGQPNKAQCALHGAEAVDEMLDAALFIWASVQRCEEPGETLRCEINIASAVESVNGMLNVILKAVRGCGELSTKHERCGLAAGVLTKSVAGLAAASGGMVAHCPQMGVVKQDLATVRGDVADVAQYGDSTQFGACIVDVKGSMKGLFQSIKRLMTVKEHCEDRESTACVHNALKIVAAFAGMGEFLAGAVDHCTKGGNQDAACSEEVVGLVHQLHNVARAGVEMKAHCDISAAERLYLDDEEEETIAPATTNNSLTFALSALLPITAVLSFVGGSRIAKARATRTMNTIEVPQEFEPLVQDE